MWSEGGLHSWYDRPGGVRGDGEKTTRGFSRRSLCLSAWTLRLFKTGTVPWASEWSYEHSNVQRQGALSADHDRLDTFTCTRLLNTVVTSLLSALSWSHRIQLCKGVTMLLVFINIYSVNRTRLCQTNQFWAMLFMCYAFLNITDCQCYVNVFRHHIFRQ